MILKIFMFFFSEKQVSKSVLKLKRNSNLTVIKY
jgi:hypothetical protein